MYHYTYQITNKESNQKYIGSRKSKLKPEEDLGIKYFTSSKDTLFREDFKSNPDKYISKVLNVFETREEALEHEIELHEKFDVAKNHEFYNLSKQTSKGFTTSVESSRRGAETRKNTILENGLSILEDVGRRSAETRKNTILENGLTIAQNVAIRSAETRKNTICENGLSIQEKTNIKLSKARQRLQDNGKTMGHNSMVHCALMRKSTILENGLSVAQDGSRKGAETRKNTILENGATLAQEGARKGGETRKNAILENGLTLAQEGARKGAEKTKGSRWMNDGCTSYYILKNDIEEKLESGLFFGRLSLSKI